MKRKNKTKVVIRILLVIAVFIFKNKYKLNESRLAEISDELKSRAAVK